MDLEVPRSIRGDGTNAEFYGATEGNISLFNLPGKQGAVGYVPTFARKVFDARIVHFDIEDEVPLRGEDGFCIECDVGEPGEILGRIKPGDQKSSVDGYTDEKSLGSEDVERCL